MGFTGGRLAPSAPRGARRSRLRRWTALLPLLVVGGTLVIPAPAAVAQVTATPAVDVARVARVNDKTEAEVVRILADPSAHVDATDRIYFVDPAPKVPPVGASVAAAPFPYSQTFLLHSRTGSQRTIYLDFDGETIANTAWNGTHGTPAGPYFAEAFSMDASAAFSNAEQDVIQSVWQRVSEDYAPFDIDVTTADPGIDAITRAGSGDQVYGTRALVTDDTDLTCTCGGFAYLGTFDRTTDHPRYQPAFVFPHRLYDNTKYIAEAVSHEAGHNLGLAHDGTDSAGYYQGHGSWAPIMGSGYTKPIVQWSTGEYADANNTEADFDVIASNGGTLVADDHGDTSASATALGSGPTLAASGLIASDADVDVFRVDLAAGAASFSALPAPVSPNLDILLELRNSAGAVLASNNPASATVSSDVASGLSASVSTTLASGTHYLFVSGVGAGLPASSGYSGYGSLGRYNLSGTVPEPARTVSVGDAPAVPEGATGASTPATFTVTLSSAAPSTVTVVASTADGTATAGADYTAVTTTVSFPAGTTSQAVPVTVVGDATRELDESFTLRLSSPSGAVILDDTGLGTITNDDSPAPQSFAYTLASTVSNGVPAAGAGNIELPGSVDTYTFTATAGQKVFVDWTTATSCFLNWRMGGPAAAVVFASRGICADPGPFTLATAGTYTLTVDTLLTSAAVGTYGFRITTVAAPQSFAYTLASTVSNGVPAAGAGNIELPGSVDTYTFTATAGQKVFVDWTTATSCFLNWRMGGPAAAVVFASRGICADPGPFTLATAGTYTLTVDTLLTSAAVGTYGFRITTVAAPQSFAYTLASTVSNGVPAAGAGNIELPGSVDTYTFTATAGQKVFVDWTTATSCFLNWRMGGPAAAVVFASRGICADPGPFTLATAGTYTLTVDTLLTSAAVGTYGFRITTVAAPQSFAYTLASTVSNGVPAAGAGNIELPGSVDTYTFTATAGQKVFVDWTTATSCFLNWRMGGPAAAVVFASRGICADPGPFTLATAGTYTLTVDTLLTSAAVGTYGFRITNVP